MVKVEEKVKELHRKPEFVRNMGIIAHIDHGKTTLSDSLLAGAGMLSMEKAGTVLKTDTLEEEQQRGITIQSTGVSMIHNVEEHDYLINLIDTPGHVDFGGEVTRALRAVDGALVLVCAVEGAMPQTETVLKQALKERVKPVLFINKVDRLIKELKLTPKSMQERFIKMINQVNKIIKDNAPKELKEKWQVSVQKGTVVFGTAIHKWALSYTVMKEKGINFKEVLDTYAEGDPEAIVKLSNKSPVHEVILNMVAKHLPNPIEAQKLRVPAIWPGDLKSEIGKSLINCNPDGPLVFCVTKIFIDPQAGEISFGRVFSGKLKHGDEVWLNKRKTKARNQQVFVMVLDKRHNIDEVPAGNTAGVIGLKNSTSGETVSDEEITPFESIKHIFDPVVTKSIEAKDPKNLVKLIQTLKDIEKEDPTMKTEINDETGEHLISGLGELHLEIIEHKIERDKNIPIVTSPPIVVYRETVNKKSVKEEGKSPNKHNKFYFIVESMPREWYDLLVSGDVKDGEVRKKDKDLIERLIEFGIPRNDAKRLRSIYKRNMLFDMSSGIVQIGEVILMIIQGFKQVMDAGMLAREPCEGIIVRIMDMKLHEDAIHRGPAQVLPAVRQGIRACFLSADASLLEPVQARRIDAPIKYTGTLSKLVQSRRGQLLEMNQEMESVTVMAKLPVANAFGFTSDLRSATEGRGVWFLVDSKFEPVPKDLQDEVVKKIKNRKGLKSKKP